MSEELKELGLEEALARLEKTAESMEKEEHTLEELMALYADGLKLSGHCEALLNKAEMEFQALEQEKEG